MGIITDIEHSVGLIDDNRYNALVQAEKRVDAIGTHITEQKDHLVEQEQKKLQPTVDLQAISDDLSKIPEQQQPEVVNAIYEGVKSDARFSNIDFEKLDKDNLPPASKLEVVSHISDSVNTKVNTNILRIKHGINSSGDDYLDAFVGGMQEMITTGQIVFDKVLGSDKDVEEATNHLKVINTEVEKALQNLDKHGESFVVNPDTIGKSVVDLASIPIGGLGSTGGTIAASLLVGKTLTEKVASSLAFKALQGATIGAAGTAMWTKADNADATTKDLTMSATVGAALGGVGMPLALAGLNKLLGKANTTWLNYRANKALEHTKKMFGLTNQDVIDITNDFYKSNKVIPTGMDSIDKINAIFRTNDSRVSTTVAKDSDIGGTNISVLNSWTNSADKGFSTEFSINLKKQVQSAYGRLRASVKGKTDWNSSIDEFILAKSKVKEAYSSFKDHLDNIEKGVPNSSLKELNTLSAELRKLKLAKTNLEEGAVSKEILGTKEKINAVRKNIHSTKIELRETYDPTTKQVLKSKLEGLRLQEEGLKNTLSEHQLNKENIQSSINEITTKISQLKPEAKEFTDEFYSSLDNSFLSPEAAVLRKVFKDTEDIRPSDIVEGIKALNTIERKSRDLAATYHISTVKKNLEGKLENIIGKDAMSQWKEVNANYMHMVKLDEGIFKDVVSSEDIDKILLDLPKTLGTLDRDFFSHAKELLGEKSTERLEANVISRLIDLHPNDATALYNKLLDMKFATNVGDNFMKLAEQTKGVVGTLSKTVKYISSEGKESTSGISSISAALYNVIVVRNILRAMNHISSPSYRSERFIAKLLSDEVKVKELALQMKSLPVSVIDEVKSKTRYEVMKIMNGQTLEDITSSYVKADKVNDAVKVIRDYNPAPKLIEGFKTYTGLNSKGIKKINDYLESETGKLRRVLKNRANIDLSHSQVRDILINRAKGCTE